MIARLRPGVTLEQARQQLNALTPAFYQDNPKFRTWYGHGNVVRELRVFPLLDVISGTARRSLLTVLVAAVAVLLVTCLNIAGLMIARAMGRSRELAVRSALGATHGQLMRLMACEGLLLALAGGALGIIVALSSTQLLLHAAPLSVPDLHGGVDPWMLGAIVLGIAGFSMTVFSVFPAWLVLRGRERRVGWPAPVLAKPSLAPAIACLSSCRLDCHGARLGGCCAHGLFRQAAGTPFGNPAEAALGLSGIAQRQSLCQYPANDAIHRHVLDDLITRLVLNAPLPSTACL